MTARRPFFVIEDAPRSQWWLICQNENVIGRVRASGRRKALAAVQGRYGGETQGTGSFYDVLIGSKLGGAVCALKSLDERLSDVKR